MFRDRSFNGNVINPLKSVVFACKQDLIFTEFPGHKFTDKKNSWNLKLGEINKPNGLLSYVKNSLSSEIVKVIFSPLLNFLGQPLMYML